MLKSKLRAAAITQATSPNAAANPNYEMQLHSFNNSFTENMPELYTEAVNAQH